MNLSGKAVKYWLQAENIKTENLLVICDDLNLQFGTMRMRKKGSNGGHNGLGNIQELLGTSEYSRLRIGIGADFSRGKQIDYVLGKIEGQEAKDLPFVLEHAAQAVKDFSFMGVDLTMNSCNSWKLSE